MSGLELTLKKPPERYDLESESVCEWMWVWKCLNSGDLRPPPEGISSETSPMTPETCILRPYGSEEREL